MVSFILSSLMLLKGDVAEKIAIIISGRFTTDQEIFSVGWDEGFFPY